MSKGKIIKYLHLTDVSVIKEGKYGIVLKGKRKNGGDGDPSDKDAQMGWSAYKIPKDPKSPYGLEIDFIREVSILKNIPLHPNIINLFDYGHVENVSYVEMELMSGNLKDLLVNQELNHKHTFFIAYQLLRGCSFVNSQGFLHHDIKLQNILYLTEKLQIKLSDFGLRSLKCEEDGKFNTGTKVYLPYESIFTDDKTTPDDINKLLGNEVSTHEEFKRVFGYSPACSFCIESELLSEYKTFIDSMNLMKKKGLSFPKKRVRFSDRGSTVSGGEDTTDWGTSKETVSHKIVSEEFSDRGYNAKSETWAIGFTILRLLANDDNNLKRLMFELSPKKKKGAKSSPDNKKLLLTYIKMRLYINDIVFSLSYDYPEYERFFLLVSDMLEIHPYYRIDTVSAYTHHVFEKKLFNEEFPFSAHGELNISAKKLIEKLFPAKPIKMYNCRKIILNRLQISYTPSVHKIDYLRKIFFDLYFIYERILENKDFIFDRIKIQTNAPLLKCFDLVSSSYLETRREYNTLDFSVEDLETAKRNRRIDEKIAKIENEISKSKGNENKIKTQKPPVSIPDLENKKMDLIKIKSKPFVGGTSFLNFVKESFFSKSKIDENSGLRKDIERLESERELEFDNFFMANYGIPFLLYGFKSSNIVLRGGFFGITKSLENIIPKEYGFKFKKVDWDDMDILSLHTDEGHSNPLKLLKILMKGLRNDSLYKESVQWFILMTILDPSENVIIRLYSAFFITISKNEDHQIYLPFIYSHKIRDMVIDFVFKIAKEDLDFESTLLPYNELRKYRTKEKLDMYIMEPSKQQYAILSKKFPKNLNPTDQNENPLLCVRSEIDTSGLSQSSANPSGLWDCDSRKNLKFDILKNVKGKLNPIDFHSFPKSLLRYIQSYDTDEYEIVS